MRRRKRAIKKSAEYKKKKFISLFSSGVFQIDKWAYVCVKGKVRAPGLWIIHYRCVCVLYAKKVKTLNSSTARFSFLYHDSSGWNFLSLACVLWHELFACCFLCKLYIYTFLWERKRKKKEFAFIDVISPYHLRAFFSLAHSLTLSVNCVLVVWWFWYRVLTNRTKVLSG